MLQNPILDAFDRRLRLAPEEAVVVSTGRRASVAEIDRLAGLARSALAPLDVTGPDAAGPDAAGPDAAGPVGLVAPNGPAFLAGFLALLRRGRAVLLFDERTPTAEKARVAAALGATAILEARRAWPESAEDFHLAPGPEDRVFPDGARPDASRLVGIAAIKLTSGSTGTPRGILVPADALVADEAALTRSMGLAEDERILASIPMSHSYGLSSVVLPALVRRAVLVVPTGSHPFEPMIAAREHEVTFLPTVPAFLQALVKLKNPPPAPSSLRLVISAGAPLRADTARRFRERFGLPVHVFYGASECGGITFDRRGTAAERGALGPPVDGVELVLEPVDGEAPGKNGTRGTVTVRSPAVARGFYPDDDPALRDGVFRTRDLGTLDPSDGLVLEGRLDALINVKGKKVNPREVEAVLARLDGVEEAVVLGVDTPAGVRLRAIVAHVEENPDLEALQSFCREHLAEHKVPRGLVLVDEIPRNARGKIDRAALLELAPRRRRE